MKGWYGNRQAHSLASKGIRVRARGEQMFDTNVYPNSYQVHRTAFINIEYVREENKDSIYEQEEVFEMLPIKKFAEKIYEYTKIQNIHMRDSDGSSRPIELSDIKRFMFADPNLITGLLEEMNGMKVKQWQGTSEWLPVTAYYPSIKGETVLVRNFGSGDYKGVVIDETIEKSEDKNWGESTTYKIKREDGTIEETTISNIELVDGKKPENIMLYTVEGEMEESYD